MFVIEVTHIASFIVIRDDSLIPTNTVIGLLYIQEITCLKVILKISIEIQEFEVVYFP